MALKPSPTNFKMTTNVARRHPRRGSSGAAANTKFVGETYKTRQEYKQKVAAKSAKTTVFGKIKDFFLGPRLSDAQQFVRDEDNYVAGAQTVVQGLKSFQQGSHKVDTYTSMDDKNLLSFLDNVKK